jgi:uncharacterized phiE125 gp8 family phage protein
MPSGLIAPLDPSSVAELKTYLRLEGQEEDDLLSRLLKSSIGLCESFTGQKLLAERIEETVRLSTEWKQLSAVPVTAVEGLRTIDVNAALQPVPRDRWEAEISDDGSARVRLLAAEPTRVRVSYLAGMGLTWADLPEPLRHGIVRLSAHLYTYRDASDDRGPPAVVAALWRPWRRYRLG